MIKCVKCGKPVKVVKCEYDEIHNEFIRYRYCKCGYVTTTTESVKSVLMNKRKQEVQ